MDVNRANHQYSLEIPDPGAQSFACYAITARVGHTLGGVTGRSFMLLSAGEEPTLGEEARASEELQDHLSGSFRGTAVSRRNEDTECAERTADDGRHQLQSLFPIYKSRLSIMAHGAAPLDLRAAGHSQIPHPVRGRAVQEHPRQAHPPCETPTPGSRTPPVLRPRVG